MIINEQNNRAEIVVTIITPNSLDFLPITNLPPFLLIFLMLLIMELLLNIIIIINTIYQKHLIEINTNLSGRTNFLPIFIF